MESKLLEQAYSLALMELEKNLASLKAQLEASQSQGNKLSLAHLEKLWQETNLENAQTCGKLLSAYLSNWEAKELIGSKKKAYLEKGLKLKVYKKAPLSLLTLGGVLVLTRSILRLKKESGPEFLDLTTERVVVPLDEALGLKAWPFKMSPGLILEICYWAVELSSYAQVKEYVSQKFNLQLSDDQVRLVVTKVGQKVLALDQSRAAREKDLKTVSKLKAGLTFLYFSQSPIKLRDKLEAASSTFIYTLLAFNLEDLSLEASKGKYRILSLDCLRLAGSWEELKDLFLVRAKKRGFEVFPYTVWLIDDPFKDRFQGAELAPKASRLLDLTKAKLLLKESLSQVNLREEELLELYRLLTLGKKEALIQALKPYLKINKVAKFITCFNEHFELFNYPKLESLGLKALEFSFKGQALGDLLMSSFLHLKHFNQDSLNAWLTLHSKKVSGVWFKEVVSVVLKFKDHLKV